MFNYDEKDFIYADELKKWDADGVVSVRCYFSKVAPQGQKLQRVPDRMWDERKDGGVVWAGRG
jgi:cytochrome P450/NADPH-cytochrome P450 reductase